MSGRLAADRQSEKERSRLSRGRICKSTGSSSYYLRCCRTACNAIRQLFSRFPTSLVI
ncbi:hypothetical protein DAI22_07g110500 [Oryza sativa Japonica Group]|nr:hypothetical protein DAI22_07g110500 [Oryza sativa Japonica Group]